MHKSKPTIYLFTDGSVNPQSKEGFGAYLLLNDLELSVFELEKKVKVKKFTNTSSTKLELETLLWALDDLTSKDTKVVVYTDCQNIISLKERRDGFEQKNYMTAKGKEISNHKLYRAFYTKVDKIDCEFIKVKGHNKSSKKSTIDDIFTIVDRASRNAAKNGANRTPMTLQFGHP
jgi:ribonuclease HI